MISRRSFLRGTVNVLGGALIPTVGRAASYQFRQVQTFDNAYFLAASPIGNLMCIFRTKGPIKRFSLRPGTGTSASSRQDDRLEIVEFGSWKTLCSVQLRQSPTNASFFADGKGLYVITDPLPGASLWQQVVFSIDGTTRAEFLEATSLDRPTHKYFAISGSELIGIEIAPGTSGRKSAILRARLPDFTEIDREAYSPFQNGGSSGYGYVDVSRDRSIVVYGVDHTIICRRTADLSVRWKADIDRALTRGVGFLSVDGNGRRVAAYVSDSGVPETESRSYIGILGADGTELRRIKTTGFYGLALSDDGCLLAIGRRVKSSDGSSELRAEIQEALSGKSCGSVTHAKWRGSNLLYLTGFDQDGLRFSPDGGFLVTSAGNMTKVWSVMGK